MNNDPQSTNAGRSQELPKQSQEGVRHENTGDQDHWNTAFDYSWKWFSYHAEQRLKGFHFFLVTISILGAVYGKLLGDGFYTAAAVTGVLGAMASFSFLVLEIRNEELVNCGREALKELETRLATKIGLKGEKDSGGKPQFSAQPSWIEFEHRAESRTNFNDSLGLITKWLHVRVPPTCLEKIVRHKFVLRAIYSITLLSFGSAVVFAAIKTTFLNWFISCF